MLITNFNAGELSAKLNGRIDIQSYFSGARLLKNWDIIPTGGIMRRTGMKRHAELHGEGRLIPFIINKDENFIFEVTTQQVEVTNENEETEIQTKGIIYIWRNGQLLKDGEGKAITIDNQWDYNSMVAINDIQYAQNYNEIILVSKHYPPYKIEYNFDAHTFTAGVMSFDFFPDVNLDDDFDFIILAEESLPEVTVTEGVIYIDGKAYPNGAFCLYNSKLYEYSIEEEDWLPHNPDDPDLETELFTTEGNYPGSVAYFNNRLFFGGSKKQPQKVWASCTPDTKKTRYNEFATYQKYITVNKTLKDEDVRIFSGSIALADIHSTGTIIRNVTQDVTKDLLKDITEYYITNDVIPVGTKVLSADPVAKTITIDTSTVAIEEDQTGLTFTMQLWKTHEQASSQDYDFQIIENNLVTSDCSFNFEVASSENDAIKWLASNNFLTIGTESTIWDCPGNISALNIQANMNGRYGSDEIQALSLDRSVIFLGQGKMSIREHYINTPQQGFQTSNIMLLAEHILTESPAVDFDYANNPANRLYIVRADGTVVSLLYDKENGIMAWSHIEHGIGKFRSCCIVRGNEQNDIIYYAVQDGEKYFLESYDSNQKVFLDSWSRYDPEEDYTSWSGAVLFNETKDEVYPIEEAPVDTFDTDDIVYIGYLYESDMISMPVVANDPTGKKRIANLLIRFLDSYFPYLKIDNMDDEVMTGEEPFSGIKNVNFPGISERDVYFKIATRTCHAVNILVINAIVV